LVHIFSTAQLFDPSRCFKSLKRNRKKNGKFPFFFLFLSTAGNLRNFSPEVLWDPSSRVSGGGHFVLPPITETGFGQLALTVYESQTTLEEVVTDEWISHLGRPLYVFWLAYSIGGQMADFE